MRSSALSIPKAPDKVELLTTSIGFSAGVDFRCDGVEDNIQIQKAIDELIAAGGGEIIYETGTYDFKSKLTAPKDPRIKHSARSAPAKGSDVGGVRWKASATMDCLYYETGDIVTVGNTDLSHDTTFDDIVFDGGGNAESCLILKNVDNVTFNRCRFVAADYGVTTQFEGDPEIEPAGGMRFIDCNFANEIANVLLANHTQDFFNNCWWSGNPNYHMIITESNKIHISNCEFNTVGTAIFQLNDSGTNAAGRATRDININGCYMNPGSGKKYWEDNRTDTGSRGIIVDKDSRFVEGVKDLLHNQKKEYNSLSVTAGSYTLNSGFGGEDIVIINPSTGNVTITLPDCNTSTKSIVLKTIADATGTVNINRSGSDTIELEAGNLGTQFTSLTTRGSSIKLFPDGDKWRIEHLRINT